MREDDQAAQLNPFRSPLRRVVSPPAASSEESFANAGSVGPTSPTAAAGVTAAPTKAKKKLGTVFRCPICKCAESVECRIDPKRKCAEAS